jgi:hypothetical protein
LKGALAFGFLTAFLASFLFGILFTGDDIVADGTGV